MGLISCPWLAVGKLKGARKIPERWLNGTVFFDPVLELAQDRRSESLKLRVWLKLAARWSFAGLFSAKRASSNKMFFDRALLIKRVPCWPGLKPIWFFCYPGLMSRFVIQVGWSEPSFNVFAKYYSDIPEMVRVHLPDFRSLCGVQELQCALIFWRWSGCWLVRWLVRWLARSSGWLVQKFECVDYSGLPLRLAICESLLNPLESTLTCVNRSNEHPKTGCQIESFNLNA